MIPAQPSAQPAQSISDLGLVWGWVWVLTLISDPYYGWKVDWEDWWGRKREIGETSGRARTGADFETCALSNADDLVQAAHGDSARSEYSVIVW